MESEEKSSEDRDFENDVCDTANDSHDNDRNHCEAENDNCDAPCEESNMFCAKSKQKFSFVISAEDWNSEVEIKEDRRGDRYLGGKWTKVFLDKLQNTNQTCPLVFKGNRVKREKTRTTKAPYFRGKVVCMFPGCVRYTLIIKRTPTAGKQVKVKVRTIPPHTGVKHERSTSKGRPISGASRASTTADLQTRTPSQVFYERICDVSSKQYRAGNMTNIGSKAVLQKISSESSLAERLHKDVITELSMQKEIYDSLDDDAPDNTVKGCIQYLSIYPFSVHIYTAQQLEILAMVIKEGDSTLYFDATGKVVSKIPDQNKRVYYYPVLLKGRQKGDPPVPVAEMISNSHNTTDVCNFFLRFLRNLHILKPNCGVPKRIEIDFSWAFLHGIIMAVNHEDLDTYLQRAWTVLHEESEWGAKVVLHICTAHLLHNISHHVGNEMKDKSARKYLKHVIGLMIDINRLSDLEIFYRNISILLLSPSEHAHKDYALAKNALDSSIMSREVKVDLLETETGEEEEKTVDTHLGESCPPGKTRFFEHFDKISSTIKGDIATTTSGTENFLYCPKLHAYITKTYMSIAPLWTGLLMDADKTHDTNSAAEYWMKIVKKDILNDKQRLRPALFIRKLRANVNGRLKEFERNLKTCTGSKQKKKKQKASFNLAQETWGGKKKKTKGVYFKPPKTLPKPKKSKTVRYSEHALHWGGVLTLPHGDIHIHNTCTVDNMLVFFNFLLDLEHVRTWFTEHATRIKTCQSLLEIKSLFQSGNWNEGRALWLIEYCSPPVEELSWNVYGSEAERFVAHLNLQESVVRSECSKRLCPVKHKVLYSTEILLGDNRDNRDGPPGSITLQESLSQWEAETELPCSDDGRCKGKRSSAERVFSNGAPPVLVASVSFLSQARGFTAVNVPDAVVIMGMRYNVFAYTVSTGSHFKGFFRRAASWHLYDGLNRPEVTEVGNKGLEGMVEHVVFVIEAS